MAVDVLAAPRVQPHGVAPQATRWEPCRACYGDGGKHVHVGWNFKRAWYICPTCWGMGGALTPDFTQLV